MLKKRLEDLLDSAKNKAVCSLNITRDDVDSIFLGLSNHYAIRFVYSQHSLKGVYYISPNSATLYLYGSNENQLPVVKKLKSIVKDEFSPKVDDLQVFEDATFRGLVKEKFIEHGVKNLFLKTLLAGSCDIIGLQTENAALVFGIQYYVRIKIAYSLGKGAHMERGEI